MSDIVILEEAYVKSLEQLDQAHALVCSAIARARSFAEQYDPLGVKPDHPRALSIVAECRSRYRTLVSLLPAARQLFEV